MATRFTRVTIAATDRQVDVSLPAAAPVGEQLPMVLRLLSVPTSSTPRRWVLSTPELGVIPRSASLDETGVLDGMVLHLTEAQEAALPPFVDDVEQTAGDLVAQEPAFCAGDRSSGIAGLLAVLLLGACGLGLVAPSPIDWVAPALALIGALGIGATMTGLGATLAAMTAVPAAVLGLSALQSGASAGATVLLPVAASIGLLGAGLVRRLPVATAGGITALVFSVLTWVMTATELQGYRTAGLIVVLGVIVAGLAGQFALGGAGLVNLLVADERGEKVPRTAVVGAVNRGGAIATGMVWAVSVAVSAAVVLLITAPVIGIKSGWAIPGVGILGALVFALRSRMYSRVRQVVPMLAVPVLAGAAIGLRIPAWFGVTDARTAAGITLGVLVLIAVLLLATGLSTLAEVPKARLRRFYEAIEFLAVLALLPGLLLVFDVIGAVQRWLA
ncbi:EsaB/YukD family protein [Nakamurella sp. A5-74]|uniref:EsaB/YukD family protein n=1 Tax=Nakamurella sp. A5-74 TaxID=3158264 RepID=A0AAU8DPG1_9ACTN